MCGIVACTGEKQSKEFLIGGLEKLEYRGYDSAGVAFAEGDKIAVYKCRGKVAELHGLTDEITVNNATGIGHTRWATHGEPSERNAHPHMSKSGRFALVHNGILENYHELKERLLKKKIVFKSDTDTEVLVALVEMLADEQKLNAFEALKTALKQVSGAYAVALLDTKNPEELVVARKGSPLVIGLGDKGGYYVASDATPLVNYAQKVIYLNDNEIGLLKPHAEPNIENISNSTPATTVIETLHTEELHIQKAGFDHFMLKEIFEQPEAIKNSLRGRVLPKEGLIELGGIEEYEDRIAKARRIVIIACGTSWHAGLVAEYYFEQLAQIPVEVEYASEFRYRDPIINEDDVVIAISQSGETADTLAALQLAKSRGAIILGICNVAGSSIARITDAGIYTHAGPEISVASTKAFTTQVSVLLGMAIRIASLRSLIGPAKLRRLSEELHAVPGMIEQTLKLSPQIKKIAKANYHAKDVLFIGRGLSFPVALEGALKLKEISYIHAEGYAAGEMKHGPIALIDKNVPVVVVAPPDRHQEKTLSNLQEVKARHGKVILLTNQRPDFLDKNDEVIILPTIEEFATPIVYSVPLQLLAYHTAVLKGCEVDQPRNLAKSVTVE